MKRYEIKFSPRDILNLKDAIKDITKDYIKESNKILKELSKTNESVFKKLAQYDFKIDSLSKELYTFKEIYTNELFSFREQCIEIMKNILKEVKEKNINNKNEEKNNVVINEDNIKKEKIKTVNVEIKYRQNGEFSPSIRTPEVHDCISKYVEIATSGFFEKEGIFCSELIYKIMEKKYQIRVSFMDSRAIASFQKTAVVMIKNYYVSKKNPKVNGKSICCAYRNSKDIAEILNLEVKQVKFNVFHYYKKKDVRLYCMHKKLALIEYTRLLVKEGLLE